MKLRDLMLEGRSATIVMEFDNESSYKQAKKDLVDKFGIDEKNIISDDDMWVLKCKYSSNKQGKDIEKTMSSKPYNALTKA